ncbi:MAG TPA: glycosyltransferase family 9 protein [Verrucomicrobiae bacterium]|nr:glycosyltransferase family 9 protein [Verrucomicrobiae bacterium]
MASPAMAALHARPERFRLTLLAMFPSVAEYLRDQQLTDDVRLIQFLHMPKLKILRNVWPLRQEHFDVSIIPYAMNRLGYNFMSRVIGANERIGFRYQRQGRMNLPRLSNVVFSEDPGLHVVQENLRWAAYLRGEEMRALPDEMLLRSRPESVREAEEFLTAHGLEHATPLIGIHPSCNSLKNQQNRCWPPQHFVQFIESMSTQMPSARFLLFEGPSDARLAGMIRQNAHSVTTARMLPLGIVGALIRRCQLFVGNDSGLLHVASACKVPCVAIFGPTNPTWVAPWKTRHVIVSRGLPCSPCFKYSSRPLSCPARLDYACVRELPLELVEAAARQLLQSPHATPINPQA